MKYEAVFGDQKRFNEQNNEMAEVMLWHDRLGPNFVSIKELSRMNLEGAIPHGSVVLAMRRIIAEPKLWTWEDKKAGRLPEVGCVVMAIGVNEVARIAAINNDSVCSFCVVFEDGGFSTLHFSGIAPIETPAEKAQREEDEFVVAMLDAASQEQLMSAGFKSGVIAAYRKLKGGE